MPRYILLLYIKFSKISLYPVINQYMYMDLCDTLEVFSYSYLFDTWILEKRKYFWKSHRKIMKFDSEIRLETLV